MKQKRPDASRLRLSLAACALVVATTTADASPQLATGAVASAAAAAGCVVDQSQILKRIDAYCRRSWQNARISRDEWEDCTQDVFLRLLNSLGISNIQQAIDDAESDERRELNRAIWATAQRRKRATHTAALPEFEIEDTRTDQWSDVTTMVLQVQTVIRRGDARLSPTQSEVIERWSAGQSISTIANALNISASSVSDEKYKAIQKLRQHFENEIQ